LLLAEPAFMLGVPSKIIAVQAMPERIKVAELPEFDAAASLSDARAAAGYLADIVQAEDEGLLSAGLADIERAGVLDEVARAAGVTPQALGELLRPHHPQRSQTLKRLQASADLAAR
jgi:DNA-binding phage protein